MTGFSKKLCDVLSYSFKNEKLAAQALRLGVNGDVGYERLEFLGDRVLGLIVARMLYDSFPNEKEGGLASRHAYLVSAPVLAKISESLGLADFLIVPKAEQTALNLHSVNLLSDICEAVIAAVYLDGGLAEAEKFVRRHWTPLMSEVVKAPVNAKTALQEWAMSKAFPLPQYVVLEKTGPEHLPVFKVSVTVRDHNAVGEGASKHAAEQQAAAALLKKLGLTS